MLNIVIKLILFLQHRFIIAVYTLRHSLLLCACSLRITQALTTRIRFHLKTQLFCYRYGYRRFRVDRQKRNFSKTLTSHYQFQAKTIRIRYRVDANFFENGTKKLYFQMKTDTCGQGLSVSKCRNFCIETPK